MSKHLAIAFLYFCLFTTALQAQQEQDSVLIDANLQECIQYALTHQPVINQSLIDEQIVDAEVKSRLSEWYPQINLDYTIQHYFKTPIAVINGTPISTAAKNFSTVFFSLNQSIFNADALFASKTKGNVRTQAKQFTENNKIYIAVNVSKAFYDVLLSRQQVNLVNQDIARLERSVKDATNQYNAGLVDKTDYKRAQISLNNAQAEKKRYQESINAKFSILKLLMGYPQDSTLNVVYDSLQLRNEIYLDTLQQVNYTNRIEYKILETQQRLLKTNVQYYKWGFIPNISAFGNYNLTYANNEFGKLYQRDFPSAYAGITFGFPIFQGGKRVWQVKSANLQLDRLQQNFTSLRDSIQTEYTQALANYKIALNDYYVQEANLELSNDVYNTIYLQYNAGVKSYLELIVAESNLRVTQVNHLNALYEVLISKLDVQKAMGTLIF